MVPEVGRKELERKVYDLFNQQGTLSEDHRRKLQKFGVYGFLDRHYETLKRYAHSKLNGHIDPMPFLVGIIKEDLLYDNDADEEFTDIGSRIIREDKIEIPKAASEEERGEIMYGITALIFAKAFIDMYTTRERPIH